MALTKKEQIAVGMATTLIIVIAFVVIWRMDQREKRLLTFATWEACMINDIYQNTSNGGAVDKGEYNKIADRCRNRR